QASVPRVDFAAAFYSMSTPGNTSSLRQRQCGPRESFFSCADRTDSKPNMTNGQGLGKVELHPRVALTHTVEQAVPVGERYPREEARSRPRGAGRLAGARSRGSVVGIAGQDDLVDLHPVFTHPEIDHVIAGSGNIEFDCPEADAVEPVPLAVVVADPPVAEREGLAVDAQV